MVLNIRLSSEIAGEFDAALDGSLDMGLERFGLCQYDLRRQRLTGIVPAAYFEHHRLLKKQEPDSIEPDETLMEQVYLFNWKERPIVPILSELDFEGRRYAFRREEGVVLVPYHTHWQEDGDLFSSSEDANWTFENKRMFLDLVVSTMARQRGVDPPVCATLNPQYVPFEVSDVPYLFNDMSQNAGLDKERGWKTGTHAILAGRQVMRCRHLTLDFIVD